MREAHECHGELRLGAPCRQNSGLLNSERGHMSQRFGHWGAFDQRSYERTHAPKHGIGHAPPPPKQRATNGEHGILASAKQNVAVCPLAAHRDAPHSNGHGQLHVQRCIEYRTYLTMYPTCELRCSKNAPAQTSLFRRNGPCLADILPIHRSQPRHGRQQANFDRTRAGVCRRRPMSVRRRSNSAKGRNCSEEANPGLNPKDDGQNYVDGVANPRSRDPFHLTMPWLRPRARPGR